MSFQTLEDIATTGGIPSCVHFKSIRFERVLIGWKWTARMLRSRFCVHVRDSAAETTYVTA